jgi:hypothetical protein
MQIGPIPPQRRHAQHADGVGSKLGPAKEFPVREAMMGDIVRPKTVPMKVAVEAITLGPSPFAIVMLLGKPFNSGAD